MHLTRSLIAADHRMAGLTVLRQMRATSEIVIRKPQIIQPCPHPLGVNRRPVMRRTGQGQMFIRQPSGLGRATFHQRQRLYHLGRTTRQNRGVRVPPCLDNTAGRVTNHRMPTMHAFRHRAAPDFSQRCSITHQGLRSAILCGFPPIASFMSRLFRANIAMSSMRWQRKTQLPRTEARSQQD